VHPGGLSQTNSPSPPIDGAGDGAGDVMVVTGPTDSIVGIVLGGEERRAVGLGDDKVGSAVGKVEAGGRLLSGLAGHSSRPTTVVQIPVVPQLLPLPRPPQR
jgi:hypothetical protein